MLSSCCRLSRWMRGLLSSSSLRRVLNPLGHPLWKENWPGVADCPCAKCLTSNTSLPEWLPISVGGPRSLWEPYSSKHCHPQLRILWSPDVTGCCCDPSCVPGTLLGAEMCEKVWCCLQGSQSDGRDREVTTTTRSTVLRMGTWGIVEVGGPPLEWGL